MRHIQSVCLLALSVVAAGSTLSAHDLGGGAIGPNKKMPRVKLTSWIPGSVTDIVFRDQATTTTQYIFAFSTKLQANQTVVGINGKLMLDLSPAAGIYLYVGATVKGIKLPATLTGTFYLQGVVFDSNGQAYFTPATQVDLFDPGIASVNHLKETTSLILSSTKKVIGSPKAGKTSAVFSKDRNWCYTVTPGYFVGTPKASVQVIDLKKALAVTTINIPGANQGIAIHPSGKLLAVATYDKGIAIVDVDPKSTKYHTVLGHMKVPYNSRKHNARALAFTPDGLKIYIAYQDPGIYGSKVGSNVGYIEFTKPGFPHKLIPVTANGSHSNTSLGYTIRETLAMSPDGGHIFTCEWAEAPGFLANGWGPKVGGALNIIDTKTNKQIKKIDTIGYYCRDMHVDRLGENLYIAQKSTSGLPQVLQIDIDKHSAKRFTIKNTVSLSSKPLLNGGVIGVTASPDGSTVYLGFQAGGTWKDEIRCFDTATLKIVGKTIPLVTGAGCHALRMQQF